MPSRAQAAPSIATIERRGIEYIPLTERWGTPRGLFWMWAGAIWNVEFLVYGVLGIVVFGLSFTQAVIVIVAGNVSYLLTGLASLQGPQAGTTCFGISRAPFGPKGNRVPSLFNWVTQVGFEIVGVALIVFAAISLAGEAGLRTVPDWLKAVFLVAAVAVQAVLPLLGHAAVLRVLKYLALPFVVLFSIMAVLVGLKFDGSSLTRGGANWGVMTVFAALVIAAGGLGWTENANDYSRYLPPGTSRTRIVLAVTLGCAIPSVLLEVLGAALATELPASAKLSVTGLTAGFAGWFAVPYLIFAILQLFAINTLDLYSSGVTLQSLVPRLSRVACVAIDTVICLCVAAYAIFSSRFYTLLSDFLLFIIVWLAPWCAIYLVDSWLRRDRYDPASLLTPGGGMYYRRGGAHWPALIAQGAGMIAAALWLNAYSPYVGPLASRIGGPLGSDVSVLAGLVTGGGLYWLLAGRRVRAEARVTPDVLVLPGQRARVEGDADRGDLAVLDMPPVHRGHRLGPGGVQVEPGQYVRSVDEGLAHLHLGHDLRHPLEPLDALLGVGGVAERPVKRCVVGEDRAYSIEVAAHPTVEVGGADLGG
jgi:nucleobase:cation symporter-1, NCS1 family